MNTIEKKSEAINHLLKQAIETHDAVSFDVFDTLLIRPFTKPHDLFYLIEEIFKVKGFAELRIRAEEEARKATKAEEIRLNDIYNRIDIAFPERLKDIEIKWEQQMLSANPVMKPVFDECIRLGKRVFIISDMYLPTDVISAILEREGYKNYEKLYVSEKYGVTKGSGNLFKLFMKECSLNPQQVLHIGDNEWSDAKKPKELGMTAFLTKKPIDIFLELPRVKSFNAFNKTNATASMLGLLSVGLLQKYENAVSYIDHGAPVGRLVSGLKQSEEIHSTPVSHHTDEEYWHDFGFAFAGPVLTGFVAHLIKVFAARKIDAVIFVGRDGYVLQKIYDRLLGSVPSYYLFAPRALSAVAQALEALNGNIKAFSGSNLETLYDYFVSRGWLQPGKDGTPWIPDEAERMEFLAKNFPREKLESEIKEFDNYLASFNLPDGRIAVIDSCSIQLSSQKLLEKFLPLHDILGCYWVIPNGFIAQDLLEHEVDTFQQTHEPEFINWNLMEFLMTAPHPSVDFISDCKPYFKIAHENERIRNEVFPLMEKGIIDFASLYQRLFGNLDLKWDAKILTAWLNLFCTVPTDEDRQHFASIKHAPDAANIRWEDCIKTWPPVGAVGKCDKDGIRKRFIKETAFEDNRYWSIFGIRFWRVKSRVSVKGWYLFGIPLLSRKTIPGGYSFKLFKLIKIFTLHRIVEKDTK